jgi:hypothetical protein
VGSVGEKAPTGQNAAKIERDNVMRYTIDPARAGRVFARRASSIEKFTFDEMKFSTGDVWRRAKCRCPISILHAPQERTAEVA